MLFGKIKKQIEEKEKQIKLDLSNNYKDAAYRSFAEYQQLIVDLKDQGKISEKDFMKIQDSMSEYKRIFKNFKG